MTDRETIQIYDEKASDYANRFASDEPNKTLLNFMKYLPAGGSVLDWGCGPATSSYHLLGAGFVPEAVDASASMVDLAIAKYGLDARVGTFDQLLPEEKYDGVWANFSLLHAARNDLPKHLSNAYNSLKPNGVFHIGMKAGMGAKRDELGRLYTFYTPDELRQLLIECGFKILNESEGEEAGLAGTVDPYILILSSKQ